MKLIHLSDLHLGKWVNEVSMIEDQEHILHQILIHGLLYHNGNNQTYMLRSRYYEFGRRL